jgi:arsenite methyltransferase
MSGVEGDAEPIRRAVRDRYAGIARDGASGCCGGGTSSCGCASASTGSQPECCADGYSASELATLPEGANLGLGCGNPSRLAPMHPGDVVLDLGSGAGIDCFLAAERVGPTGRVIGVDMTPEMVARSRSLARASGRTDVEFRLGEIEHLPAADDSVDVVLSNCVINLVPDKTQVYREAYRVLRPGGRLAVADVLATRPIPNSARADLDQWTSCSAGALTAEEVTTRLREAGFESIEITFPGADTSPDSRSAQADLGVLPAEVRASKSMARRP